MFHVEKLSDSLQLLKEKNLFLEAPETSIYSAQFESCISVLDSPNRLAQKTSVSERAGNKFLPY